MNQPAASTVMPETTVLVPALTVAHVAADPDDARRRYDVEAPWYDGLTGPFQHFREQAVARLELQPGDVVYDIGCGTGLAFEALEARVGPTGRIIGVDVSPAMLDEAFNKAARRGWHNIELVQSPVEDVVFPDVGDAALFCATHDILQSPTALERVVDGLRPGASVAAAGGKWAAPWAAPLNIGVLWLHAPYVTTFEGFGRPWAHLADLLDDVIVEETFWGTGYLLAGTVPPILTI